MKISASIVVPVYNEQESVRHTLTALKDVCTQCMAEFEIIAVDDCSRDGSGAVLDSLAASGITVIHHPTNRGYGASLKTGITVAQFPWILITDADGTYPIDRITDLVLHADRADMVVGARTGKKVSDTLARSIGRGFVRRFASYVAGYVIPDVNSGLRLFKKSVALNFWHLFPERFSFTTTITVACHTANLPVVYVPIDYHKRTGASSIKPVKDFVGFMSLIGRLAVYFRPLKVFLPLSSALFILGVVVLVGSWLFLPTILDSTFAILVTASLQTLFFGLIADMIIRRIYSRIS